VNAFFADGPAVANSAPPTFNTRRYVVVERTSVWPANPCVVRMSVRTSNKRVSNSPGQPRLAASSDRPTRDAAGDPRGVAPAGQRGRTYCAGLDQLAA
jgi:hypothetical protein